MIEDFLIGTGVDGYLEIDQRAGMELSELKRRFGSRITFLGNMDCGEVLSFWAPERIAEETVRCLRDGDGVHGGHIFCASNAITTSVPVQNYLAMLHAYQDWFGLPRFQLSGGVS